MLMMDYVSVTLFYISVSSPYFAHFVTHFISSRRLIFRLYICITNSHAHPAPLFRPRRPCS